MKHWFLKNDSIFLARGVKIICLNQCQNTPFYQIFYFLSWRSYKISLCSPVDTKSSTFEHTYVGWTKRRWEGNFTTNRPGCWDNQTVFVVSAKNLDQEYARECSYLQVLERVCPNFKNALHNSFMQWLWMSNELSLLKCIIDSSRGIALNPLKCQSWKAPGTSYYATSH